MSNTLALPILKHLVPAGFGYGTNLLVEFESQSLWYILTIAGNALKAGIRTDYQTLQHFPNEVAGALERLGLDVEKLREEKMFGIIDSYTVQSGFGAPKITDTGRSHYQAQSVKLSDWRAMRGRPYDSRWHKLRLLDSGEVALAD